VLFTLSGALIAKDATLVPSSTGSTVSLSLNISLAVGDWTNRGNGTRPPGSTLWANWYTCDLSLGLGQMSCDLVGNQFHCGGLVETYSGTNQLVDSDGATVLSKIINSIQGVDAWGYYGTVNARNCAPCSP
jgi:hypothetical protein